MSGVDLRGPEDGAPDSQRRGGGRPSIHEERRAVFRRPWTLSSCRWRAGRNTARRCRWHHALGVVHLKDVVKGGIRERFAQLRKMGIRTVMITGDNR